MAKYHLYVCLIAIASTIGFAHGQAGELTIVGGSEGMTNLTLEVKNGTPPYTYILDQGTSVELELEGEVRTLLSFRAVYYAPIPDSYIGIHGGYGAHTLIVKDSTGKVARANFTITRVPPNTPWVW